MKGLVLSPVWSLLFAASLLAQNSSPAPQVHTSDIGFSYSLPSEWEVVDTRPSLPAVKENMAKGAQSEVEKKGLACVQIEFTARHGNPATVIVVVALPYECFGQSMTDKDLPGFASGAAEGLKQTFDIVDPVYGAYSLGSHSLWIERAEGVPKERPDSQYTIEVSCGLLKKGAVCWMAMAADPAGLEVFERGVVTLDGESAGALVPPTAFEKKPS